MVFPGFQVGGSPNILGLRPRLTATRSKIPTRYCPKVGHSDGKVDLPVLHCTDYIVAMEIVWKQAPIPFVKQNVFISSLSNKFIVTHRQEYLKIRTFALENYQFGGHPAIARKVISHVMVVRSLRNRYLVNEPITIQSAATLCQSDHQ